MEQQVHLQDCLTDALKKEMHHLKLLSGQSLTDVYLFSLTSLIFSFELIRSFGSKAFNFNLHDLYLEVILLMATALNNQISKPASGGVVDMLSTELRTRLQPIAEITKIIHEAKQAIELMGRWEIIDVCDALELISPVFESEEIKMAHEKSVYDPGEEMEWKYRWRVVLQEKTEFNVQLIEFRRRKCYKSQEIEDKSWSIEEAKRGVSINFLKVVVSKGSRNRGLEIKARKTVGGKIEVEVDKPLGLTLDPKSGAGGGVVITGVDGWECCKSRVEGG